MLTLTHRFGIGLAIAFVLAASAHADLVVYDDSLENGFIDYSYGGGSNFATAAPVHGGSKSIALTGNSFNALSFFHGTGSLASASYPMLKVWINGGSVGGQQFTLVLENGGGIVAQAALNAYLPAGGPAANAWQLATITFSQPPLAYSGAFDRIDIQSDAAGAQATAYFDDITLGVPVVVADEIFKNGFEIPVGVAALSVEHDVTINSMSSDRFRWRDRAGQPREAALAHNDGQTGPGGTRGGELRQFQYETPGGTRTVNASGGYASGFGYVVSHAADESNCTGGGDPSSLGHFTPGTFQRLFEGRHHAILRFTQAYPRYCTVNPPAVQHNIPVTIDWLFATGRDNPLWAITFDMNGIVLDGVLDDDSRAPYGELLFDGSASEGAHSTIAGVAWGDRYKFLTTTSPVTLNSAWDWSAANTIPYVALWTTAIDATMGIVQTQTIAQHDAGGYWGVNRWGSTSGAGAACGASYVMVCDYNWPYQSINYSLNSGLPNQSTNNTRLAWGADFGFLGRSAYEIHGSAYYGGPLGNATAVGWPRQSYSTFVVLGLHSTDPVGTATAAVEKMQSLTLSASVGSVVTSGPAGIARADTITYQPSGYDPVYSALRFNANGGALNANIAVSSGSLVNPLLIVGNVAALPGAVSLNGAALTADVDYFASLRADKNELWITLHATLSGAANTLSMQP